MTEKDEVLRSLERLRSRAGHVHQDILELQNSVTFDPRLPNVADRASRIEAETRSLADDVARVRDHLKALRHRGDG